MTLFSRLSAVIRAAMVGAWLTSGCTDRVDLGNDVPLDPSSRDSGPPDDGLAATVLQFDENLRGCFGIAVDDTYLYFSTMQQNGASLHRCGKSNCVATLTRIARPPCNGCLYDVMVRQRNRLALAATARSGIGGFFHVAACTPPDCNDLQRVLGEYPEMTDAVFAEGQIYFGMPSDRAIYTCTSPSCSEGPRTFARGTSPGLMSVDAEWVYWIDNQDVKRKRRDQSSAVERLDLGAVLGPFGDGGAPLAYAGPGYGVARDNGWLYAAVIVQGDLQVPCAEAPGSSCTISRWKDDPLGNPREIVYRSDTIMSDGFIRNVSGELVFEVGRVAPTTTYSCDAANCAATVRSLGDAEPRLMTNDDNYLYWCSSSAEKGFGALRRAPRLRRAP